MASLVTRTFRYNIQRKASVTVQRITEPFVLVLKAPVLVSAVTVLPLSLVYIYPNLKSVCLEVAPRTWASFCNFLTPPYLFLLVNFIIITIAVTSHPRQMAEHESQGVHANSDANLATGHGPSFYTRKKSTPDESIVVTTNEERIVENAVCGLHHGKEVSNFGAQFEQPSDDSDYLEGYMSIPFVPESLPSAGVATLVQPNPNSDHSNSPLYVNDANCDQEESWRLSHKAPNPHVNHKFRKSETSRLSRSQRSHPSLHKSETFNATSNVLEIRAASTMETTHSAKVHEDETFSESLDELNRRVEDFIAKFNEQIRLQGKDPMLR